MPKKKFYAVRVGSNIGIYEDWDTVKQYVQGYSGAQYKSFQTLEEAQAYMNEGVKASTKSKAKRAASSKTINSNEILYAIDYKKPISSSNGSSDIIPEYVATASSSSSTYEAQIPKPVSIPKVASLSSKTQDSSLLVVYTDGACSRNGTNHSSAGIGVYFGPDDPRNITEPLYTGRQTNQRAELTAAIRALETVPLDQPLEIRTDSSYVYKGATQWIENWTPEKFDSAVNGDLFRSLKTLKDARTATTKFSYVPAHSGVPGNEAADQLAVLGASKGSKSL